MKVDYNDIMTQVGRLAFFKALGIPVPEADDDKLEQWSAAAETVEHFFNNQIEIGFSDLARKAYEAYRGNAANWDKESKPVQLAWQAAVRQMAISRLPEEEVSDEQPPDWTQWAAERLAGKTAPPDDETPEGSDDIDDDDP